MKRRAVIVTAPAALLALAGCTLFQNQQQAATTLAKAKSYASDLVGALHSAAQVFTASPQATAAQASLVSKILADLDTANTALQAMQVASGAKAIVQQIIAFAQQIVPIVAPFAGAAGPYFALALAVLQAFVAGLPSSTAPEMPPAALHRAALRWHGR